MNEFDKRINELRIQFRRENVQIAKDAYRQIGHLNNAISQTTFPGVRDALRAEKERIFEAMRNSHRYNRTCYIEQLEAIEDERLRHYERVPSKTKIRRLIGRICQETEANGETSVTIAFGNNRKATISFE